MKLANDVGHDDEFSNDDRHCCVDREQEFKLSFADAKIETLNFAEIKNNLKTLIEMRFGERKKIAKKIDFENIEKEKRLNFIHVFVERFEILVRRFNSIREFDKQAMYTR